jgi:hypothetical protein
MYYTPRVRRFVPTSLIAGPAARRNCTSFGNQIAARGRSALSPPAPDGRVREDEAE